ncbi:MAG: alpha/beta fold hydrolase [Hyphomicrobiales bacterium]|nr:alpha/beta fold hydrolase [Hyphomicrobiales bacterium]
MIPVVFDNCRGWLHEGAAARGVVICGAHGFEDLCARSSLRLLAEEISARDVPVLRFDWRGAADSEGDGEAPHRVATWLGNIGEAARTLVERTGVSEVVLVGLRLGALLALEAARDILPCRLVLLAPPASGKALGREIEIMSRIFQGKPGAAEDKDFDGVSSAGFRISRATMNDLALVGSRRFSGAASGKVLLLTQTPDGSPLTDKMRAAGANVVCETFEGYAEMMCDPTAALPPAKAIARIADFVCEGAIATPHPEEDRAAMRLEGWPQARRFETRASPAPQHEGCGDDGVLSTDVWRESAAMFGPQKRLVGIFCAPASGEASPRKAVLFLNSGGVYHIGWARMFVDMARDLARSGIASLRMDLSGVGDSLSPAGPGRAPLYESSLTNDVEAAIDWLFERGVADVSLFGACSGAYQAFHAAIQDRRVRKLALVNTLCFVYGATTALQIEAWRRTKAADVAMKLSSAEHEEETPRGARALLFQLAKKVVKAGLAQATDARSAIRRAVPGMNPVERWFGELSARGSQTLLVYSENDPGLAELERHLGPRSRQSSPMPGVRTAVIAAADHELTPQSARKQLSATLDAFVTGKAA